MKKIANALMPLAALALFGTFMTGLLGLIVVLMTSVGFADEVPWLYYQKLNIGIISVTLPIVAMILLVTIFLGLREKNMEAAKPAIIERDINRPGSEGEAEKEQLKTAA